MSKKSFFDYNFLIFQNYWTAFYNWQPDNPIMLQNNQGYLGSMTPHGATIKRRPPINQRYGESVNEPHRQMY